MYQHTHIKVAYLDIASPQGPINSLSESGYNVGRGLYNVEGPAFYLNRDCRNHLAAHPCKGRTIKVHSGANMIHVF